MTTRRVVVGLTGTFGTGKSTVAHLFRKMGAQVLDADQLAHEVFRKGNRIYSKIRSLFPEIQGGLTRAQVARIVFQDSERRRRLESLIHPYVFRRIRQKLGRMRSGVVVVEVPLLFETGFEKCCDATVVVTASRDKVLKRLAAQGMAREEIDRRRRAQMPLEEKMKRADYRVNNSDGPRGTGFQVKKIWKKIREEFYEKSFKLKKGA